MATHNPTEAEIFQQFLAVQITTTDRTKSPEELVRLWRQRQHESSETLAALNQGIADLDAGCVHPFDEVNEEIRRKHGWTSAE